MPEVSPLRFAANPARLATLKPASRHGQAKKSELWFREDHFALTRAPSIIGIPNGLDSVKSLVAVEFSRSREISYPFTRFANAEAIQPPTSSLFELLRRALLGLATTPWHHGKDTCLLMSAINLQHVHSFVREFPSRPCERTTPMLLHRNRERPPEGNP